MLPHDLNPISRKVRPFEQRSVDGVQRGRIAGYVFIEPRYMDTPEWDASGRQTGRWFWANDQHLPHDVPRGEKRRPASRGCSARVRGSNA